MINDLFTHRPFEFICPNLLGVYMTCDSNNPNFSYEHYRSILLNLKERYKFSNFDNNSTNDVILRHDVDISLDYALEMAKIEHKLDVTATYFILFHADLYNPFNIHSTRVVSEILKLGHKIGFHYDISYYEENNLVPKDTVLKEIKIMEQEYGTEISVVSAHRPSRKYVALDLPEYRDAYADEFVKDRKYLSDSGKNWREGCICKNYTKYDKIQLLIHPVWWTKDNLSREQILDRENGTNTTYAKAVIQWRQEIADYLQKLEVQSNHS